MKENKGLKYFLWAFRVWGSVGIFLASLQVYLMFDLVIVVLPLFFVAVYFFNFGLKKTYYKMLKPGKVVLVIWNLIAFIHFLPLIFQLVGLTTPGPDNLIVALIGLWMFLVLEN